LQEGKAKVDAALVFQGYPEAAFDGVGVGGEFKGNFFVAAVTFKRIGFFGQDTAFFVAQGQVDGGGFVGLDPQDAVVGFAGIKTDALLVETVVG